MPQTYANHAHLPVPTVVGYLFLIVALVALSLRWFEIGGRATFAIGLFAIVVSLATVLAISRLYITRLQDRIIKLEMRVRTAGLLTAEQHRAAAALSIKQIAGLRFASDEELPALIERASREQMKPDDIKRAIKHWVPDLDRT